MNSLQKSASETADEKMFDEFLSVMINSSNKRKVCVRFRLVDGEKEHKAWFTYTQYRVFRKIECVKYCHVVEK